MSEHDGSRRAERHAEFGFETGLRAIVNEQTRRHRVDLDVDRADVGCLDVVTMHDIEEGVERRVRGRAGRVELHRNTRVVDFPSRSEIGGGSREILGRASAVHRGEIALRSGQRVFAGGEPASREHRGHHAVTRGCSRVQRLGHGPDVFLQPARERRGDAQRVRDLFATKAQHARSGGSRSESADR